MNPTKLDQGELYEKGRVKAATNSLKCLTLLLEAGERLVKLAKSIWVIVFERQTILDSYI